jgi:hypothetical protein
MRSRTLLFGVTIFVLLFCQLTLAGQKLRYNFEQGKIYKYSTTIESKLTGQAGGQEFSMTSGAALDYSISLLSTDAKEEVLKIQFDKFTIKINMPMMGFTDSTIALQEYIGKRIKLVITKLGKTVSVEPIDTVPPSRILMQSGLTPSDLFRQLLLELPEKEMSVNDSWKREQPDTLSRSGIKITMKPNIECKIIGTEKKLDINCLAVSVKGTSTVEGTGSQQGADVSVDGIVKVNGSVFFAPSAGIPVLSEQTTETEMTTTVTGAQTGAQTMSITATSKTILVP